MENKIKKLKSANTTRQKYEPAMQRDVQGKTVCMHARVHVLMMRYPSCARLCTSAVLRNSAARMMKRTALA